MKRLSIALLGACFFLQFVSRAPAQIIWVSFNGNNDGTPADDAAAAGLTEASDIGYTNLLAESYEVQRYLTHDNPTPEDLELLNSADLVIVSRSVNSPQFQDPPELEFWNTMVTTPVMMMSGYITRDSRLMYFDGATMVDTTGAEKLEAIQPDHPIFAGVDLDGSNVMVNNYTDGLVDLPPLGEQRGISINNNNVIGGNVIARISADGSVANGVVIAEWEEGVEIGGGQVLAGPRLTFLSGSRENGGPVSTAGAFDLTDDGAQLFLNAVDYLSDAPPPNVLSARINTSTGEISIVNQQMDAFTIDYIELTSDNGNLDPDNWTPLGTGTDDGSDWEVVGTPSENDLSQFFLLGDETINPNGSVTLGTAFDTSTSDADRDIEFRYHSVDTGTRRGIVEFFVPPSGSADIDGNGVVDGNDWKIMQRNWNMPGTLADGDANGDGTVDAADQDIWEAQFGSSVATAASTAVPEPATWLLAAVAGCLGLAAGARRQLS